MTNRRSVVPVLVSLALLALATESIPASASPLFSAPYCYDAATTTAEYVAVADLNGDGITDLAVADWSQAVSVLLGRGDGTFGPRRAYLAAGHPLCVAIGDLNGDGRPDLVTANGDVNTVSVLLGHGDGTFADRADVTVGGSSEFVAIGDLNGDGRPDLVTANSNVNTVSVLLGNGDGTFAASADFAVGASPRSVAIGDLNGDGRPDLVTANSGANTVSVLLGDGSGTFGGKTDFATGSAPYSVAIGDLNGDGRPDLATANSTARTISVLLGGGNGTFGAKLDFGADTTPRGIAIGDLNGDGRADLAVANSGSGTVSVLLWVGGAGIFGTQKIFFASEYGPQNVVIADLNRDGKPDLTLPYSQTMVSVLLGKGDGTFGWNREFATGTGPQFLTIGDLNADGRADLAVATSDFVSVLLGNGDGTFGAQEPVVGPGTYSTFVALADLDGDSKTDMVVLTYADSVTVLLGKGDGTFWPMRNYRTGNGPFAGALGDLNRDGRLDIVTADISDSTVSVLLGNGDGTFQSGVHYRTGYYSPRSVAIGDLNRDGAPDLVVLCLFSTEVLLGNGDGTFGTATVIAPVGGFNVALADLNGDGSLDVVVGGGVASVLLGQGDGSFAPKVSYYTGEGCRFVGIGDFNLDGRPDLVAANTDQGSFGNSVSVLLGNGDGTFAAKIRYGMASKSSPNCVAIGDLNGDGASDLAFSELLIDKVGVLLNASSVPVATEASLVSVSAEPGLVRLEWYASASAFSATVYRRTEGTGWTALGDVVSDGTGHLGFEDHAVEAGQRYGYRLGFLESGNERSTAETWVSVPATAEFALEGLRPNPTSGALAVALSLPSAAPARLELLDVSGRRLLERDLAGLGPGRVLVPLGSSAALKPGLYFLRLSQGGRRLVSRGCVVR